MHKPARRVRGILSDSLQGAFFLGYPLIVYLAYTRLEARALAFLLLGLYAVAAALRIRDAKAEIGRLVRQHSGLAVLLGIAIATGNATVVLFSPAIVSLYLLWTFSASLRGGVPMVERLARIVEDDLPDFTLPYCRKVTIVWCAFLASNALCAGALALVAPLEWWALYTGLIAYLLVGALLAGEFIVRKIWFRHFSESPLDRIFSRLFPPGRTANGRRSLAYQQRRERGETIRSSA